MKNGEEPLRGSSLPHDGMGTCHGICSIRPCKGLIYVTRGRAKRNPGGKNPLHDFTAPTGLNYKPLKTGSEQLPLLF